LIDGGVDAPLEPGTSGKVKSEYFDVRIFNESDEEVSPGTVGEVVVRPRRPKIMFDGYYGDADATVAAWSNLWFHTGDLGSLDTEGNFRFFDRKKDYIRRRAENISSFEVQRAALNYPPVIDVAAVGVPSELGEEEVKVCLVLAAGAEFDPVDFLAHCVSNMPYYAVPRYVEVVDALPLTPSGKVAKHLLRSSAGGRIWDREAEGYAVDRKVGLVRAGSG
jgi:crotonobetaine/carnitine-CoA ligase